MSPRGPGGRFSSPCVTLACDALKFPASELPSPPRHLAESIRNSHFSPLSPRRIDAGVGGDEGRGRFPPPPPKSSFTFSSSSRPATTPPENFQTSQYPLGCSNRRIPSAVSPSPAFGGDRVNFLPSAFEIWYERNFDNTYCFTCC